MKQMLAIVLSVLLLAGCTPAPREAAFRQATPTEAAALMESEENYLILDVRTPEEFAQGHIPHAVNLPNESIGTQEIPGLPQKDQLLLVYCRSGNRSKQAARKLAALGYTNVTEFGGIINWPGPVVTD